MVVRLTTLPGRPSPLNGQVVWADESIMSSGREIRQDPDHSILTRAWEFEIVGLRLERDPIDGTEAFLDLTLQRGPERRILRFWSPRDLEIERGGPVMTSGLVILDLSARGLDRIAVKVDDFEASPGSVRFVARQVEDVSGAPG
jgi:hypothetical protein